MTKYQSTFPTTLIDIIYKDIVTVAGHLVFQITFAVFVHFVQRQLAVVRGRGQFGDVVHFLAVCGLDYVVGRVVRERTMEPDGGQERHHLVGGTLVHAVAPGQHVHVVEQLEHGGARLVDGAHDGSALVRESSQQLQAERAGNVVQSAAEILIYNHLS